VPKQHLDPIEVNPSDVYTSRAVSNLTLLKNGVTASLLMLRKQIVAPFIIANYSDIDYFHQASNPAINRSAKEAWGVAGIRITLSSDLQIDLGMQHTHRQFEDRLRRIFQLLL
jgi:hypothetical protein